MNIKELPIHKLFLIISILFGIILVFIVPPFQSPDEDSHFLKSYLISAGQFFPKQKDGKIGYNISKNLDDYIQEKLNFINDLDKKYSYKEQYYDQLLSFSYEEKEFKNISTSQTAIIAHIVPAVGIKIGSFMKSFDSSGVVGPAVLLQFGRLFSLIIYSIIGYFAIKITPKFKKTFFTILLLPSSLFLRSMITYDSLILVTVALSVAKMLQLFCNENYKFKKKDIILFIICGYILLNIKTVYSFIFLLMFAIPKEKFDGTKNKIKYFVIMILSVLILTILLKIPYLSLDASTSSLAQSQIQFIIHNPVKYLAIVFNNIYNQLPTQAFWMVGTYGLLDTYVPVLLLNIIYLNLIFIIIYETIIERLELPLYVSISYILLILLSIITIYTFMYIYWTPGILDAVCGNEITGVQGRYLLPYLFIIPLIFGNKLTSKIFIKVSSKIKNVEEKYSNSYAYLTIICLIISLVIIFERYWI